VGFEFEEGSMLGRSPVPIFSFLSEIKEWSSDF